MRLTIHIGLGKTGTSSIQASASSLRDALLERGVLYPKLGTDTNHNRLSISAIEVLPRSYRSLERNSDVKTEGLRVWEDLRDQVVEFTPNEVVLSGEYLARTDPSKIRELIETYLPQTTSVGIICYIRNHDARALSLLQQKIKASHSIHIMTGGYTKTLSMWNDFDSFDFRHFDRNKLIDGDVVSDFFEAIGQADIVKELKNSTKINESLTAEGMYLMQKYRFDHHANSNDVLTKDSFKYLRIIQRSENRLRKKVRFTKPKFRSEIMPVFVAANKDVENISERYGIQLKSYPETETLDSDIKLRFDDLNEVISINELALENLASHVIQRIRLKQAKFLSWPFKTDQECIESFSKSHRRIKTDDQ